MTSNKGAEMDSRVDEIIVSLTKDAEYPTKTGFIDYRLRNEAKSKIQTLINNKVKEARVDEILRMRAVGDRVAAQAGATFEELSGAYDAHILKRAADLTEPQPSSTNSEANKEK